MALRHKKQTNFPAIETDKSGIQKTFDDAFRVCKQAFLNIYDDLNNQDTRTNEVLYFGDPDTNGAWRIITSGNNLAFERREAGSWVEKSVVLA